MRGFGEPSSQVENSIFGLTTTRPYSWGFGDPSAAVNLETQPDLGFGDVMPDSRFVILVGGARGVPDDGGVIITLRGHWPSLNKPKGNLRAGPFLVRLKDRVTGLVYPQDEFGCHSGRVGGTWECTTDIRHETLTFVLPPLPLSDFDIEIRFGHNWLGLITLPRAFRVLHRVRASETYNNRKQLAVRFASGPRFPGQEKLRGD